MNQIIITKKDNGNIINCDVGDLIIIKLGENPTTGYKWIISDINEKLIKLKDADFSVSSDQAVGSGGIRIFFLNAISSGLTKIELKLIRFWKPQNLLDSFQIVIDINKN